MVDAEESCNAFARDLYDAVISDDNIDNILFSPISIQTALVFAYLGSEGTTAEELRQGLKLKNVEHTENAKIFRDFWKKHANYGSHLTLKSVNRIFVNENLHLRTEFSALAGEHFQSQPESLRFAESEQATNRINDLVSQDTEDKIEDLLQPDAVNAETSAVLVSALYFKGKFLHPFTPESTISDDFYLSSESRVEVEMMYQEDKFNYVELPEIKARAIQLPYDKSDISLCILLPDTIYGIKEMEMHLKTLDWQDIDRRMHLEDVEIALPKFTLEFDMDLIEILQQLGISELFSDSANLSRLFTDNTGQKISAAKHRGYIQVNEAGSEASAVTFMKIVPMMLNMQKKTFKVDHPFAFFIRDSQAVFFAGRFVEPPGEAMRVRQSVKSDSITAKISKASTRNTIPA